MDMPETPESGAESNDWGRVIQQNVFNASLGRIKLYPSVSNQCLSIQ